MKIKICLSYKGSDEQFNKMVDDLSKVADVTKCDLDIKSLQGYDIFIGKKLTKEALETADNLKAIFAYKTGVDDFPLKDIKERGIVLVNSHADSHYIAQYAVGLAISLAYRITEFDRKFRNGIWYDSEVPYWRSFFGMKIGLLGYGHIGRDIHSILKTFDSVEVYTLNRGKDYEDITLADTVEELCEKVDMLILSLPKTEATTSIINENILKLLKGKYIVNVGRGNAIDQEAFFSALGGKRVDELRKKEGKEDVTLPKDERSNYLAGAAVDTWNSKPEIGNTDFYPFDKETDFTILDNIVLSPHQAMKVADGFRYYIEDITNKVTDYIETGKLSDLVDLDKGY